LLVRLLAGRTGTDLSHLLRRELVQEQVDQPTLAGGVVALGQLVGQLQEGGLQRLPQGHAIWRDRRQSWPMCDCITRQPSECSDGARQAGGLCLYWLQRRRGHVRAERRLMQLLLPLSLLLPLLLPLLPHLLQPPAARRAACPAPPAGLPAGLPAVSIAAVAAGCSRGRQSPVDIDAKGGPEAPDDHIIIAMLHHHVRLMGWLLSCVLCWGRGGCRVSARLQLVAGAPAAMPQGPYDECCVLCIPTARARLRDVKFTVVVTAGCPAAQSQPHVRNVIFTRYIKGTRRGDRQTRAARQLPPATSGATNDQQPSARSMISNQFMRGQGQRACRAPCQSRRAGHAPKRVLPVRVAEQAVGSNGAVPYDIGRSTNIKWQEVRTLASGHPSCTAVHGLTVLRSPAGRGG
jgi:hypothetical protein